MRPADSPWERPGTTLLLRQNEVHVWRFPLDVSAPALEEMERLLAPGERARAASFVFTRDRRRHVAAHGALRTILAHYLSVPAVRLVFGCGPHGKPRLLEPLGPEICFNLSHSADLGLLVVARGRELGIDVEAVRYFDGLEALAASCFSPREISCWRELPAGLRQPAFFATWTRKEAYLKAVGAGLARPLADFDVTVVPGEPARLLRDAIDPSGPERWTLHTLTLEEGFVATVVFEGSARVVCWAWRPDTEHRSRRARRPGDVHRDGEPQLDLVRGDAASHGWRSAGKTGPRSECLSYTKEDFLPA